jgi:hypothetical protein
VAEVYIIQLLAAIEARASGANKRPFVHRIKLLVPAFDPNYVMWPSYVEKLHLHYADELLQRQAALRAQAIDAASQRAAARAGDGDDEEEGLSLTRLGGWPRARSASRVLSWRLPGARALDAVPCPSPGTSPRLHQRTRSTNPPTPPPRRAVGPAVHEQLRVGGH